MSKFDDPEIRKKLIAGIYLGLNFEDAALYAGITRGTFYNWRKWAKKSPKGKYGKGFGEFSKALIAGKAKHLKNISDAGNKGSWCASAWILERRYPEEFGLNRMVDQPKEKAQPVSVIIQVQDASKKAEDGSKKE